MSSSGRVLVVRRQRPDHLLAQRSRRPGPLEERPGIEGHRVLAAGVDVRRGRRRADLELMAGRGDRQVPRLGERADASAFDQGKRSGGGRARRSRDGPAENREHGVDRAGREPGGDVGAAAGRNTRATSAIAVPDRTRRSRRRRRGRRRTTRRRRAGPARRRPGIRRPGPPRGPLLRPRRRAAGRRPRRRRRRAGGGEQRARCRSRRRRRARARRRGARPERRPPRRPARARPQCPRIALAPIDHGREYRRWG